MTPEHIMCTLPNATRPSRSLPLDVHVCGPGSDPLSADDIRRLFPGSTLTQSRLDRLRDWPRVVVTCGGAVVGVATCQKTETEMRVPEIGVDAARNERDVLGALLEALELAGLAGACRRLVVLPPRTASVDMARRGYTGLSERCAGMWLEKPLI